MRDRLLGIVHDAFEASVAVKRAFLEASAGALVQAARAAADAVSAGGRILLFGNGGSAADAQHIAAEFVNRLDRDRPGIAALALTTDTSVLTSIANDAAYERVFARQLEAMARREDVAVAISASGSSPNVVAGLDAAQAMGLLTIGLLGRDGGKCRARCHHALVVAGTSTQRIQECHILLGHLLAQLVEEQLYPAELA